MNLTPDDPRLSAWVLGELPADEAEAIGHAVAADPALQAAADELRGVCSFLDGTFAAPALRPEQREAVRLAGRTTVIEFPARKKKVQHWQTLLATAAVIAFGVFLISRIETGSDREVVRRVQPSPGTPPTVRPVTGNGETMAGNSRHAHNVDGAPDSALADFSHIKLPEAAKLPATSPLDRASDLDLPLVVGRSSYDWVRGWIEEKNQLPPKEAVRIEELANAFPLPPEEETESFAGLRVACVSMASLWSGPGRLVGVQIANESGQARRVSWAFRPAPGSREGGVRVLASTGGDASVPSTLPAGRRTLVLIELTSAAGEAGDLVVSADGRSRRIPAVETKAPGLRQAALVAAFGIWLRKEGIDDARLREILVAAGENTDPRSKEVRQLVGRALDIAAAGR
ncbi:von Willebrand factor type A domain-containing protein [Luteolibacter arcticus]|uniref:von Willebrand factor type A domain-containing protein n=1 Tax=Luteolibacter arcticus TaxID=1581411 RepID=A0ABT3GME7_9BACT|nr:von Willebrand factor type A domain-containing protein [Luteolibacter arcticus]MCW1924690.1 von Willebrand factor type A domain-containing protein [Luteolibacter arcticus]